jgi:hypothetical protein
MATNKRSRSSAWVRGLLRDVAWPGVVVLVAHAIFGEVFGHEPYVDPAMHFLGGVAAAYFFSRLGPYVPSVFGGLHPGTRRALAFSATTTVAVVWEFGEFISDVYLGTRTHTSIASTLRDILNGMLGAALLLIIQFLLKRGSVGQRYTQT